MKQLSGVTGLVRKRWMEAPARSRLIIGMLLIAMVGLSGLTPNVVLGQALVWPYAGIIAAAGWGRSGLAFAPMLALIAFGIAQDVTSGAPIGSFALVNILVFGASAGLSQTFDLERSNSLSFVIPILTIALGFLLVWLIASISGGYFARFSPLLWAMIATLLLNVITSPVFDLGIRRGQNMGVPA